MDYKELKNLLIKANDAYYKNDNPILSDYDFDIKLKELEKMEKDQGFADDDSPTKKPGSDLSSNIGTRHKRPMLSLENTYNAEEVHDWYLKMKEFTRNDPVVACEFKYDGNSAAIHFKNGKVVKALTRGDGLVGEDITKNISMLSDLKNVSKDFSGEVRGELIITKEGFAELNKDGKYQNARNLCAGTLKLLKDSEFKAREKYIHFYAYWNEEDPTGHHNTNIKYLSSMGFRTSFENMVICKSYDELISAINNIEKLKPTLEIDIDGAVMKLNDTKYWNEIGSTAKFPRWAKAYKYKQESVKTIVKNITFEVGRTGKITPLAWFEPVFLDGSTIQKATLNNKDFYEAMDVAIGDTVCVQKAAAIIPQIIDVERSSNRKVIPFPDVCPCCGSKLSKHNDEHADVFCDNEKCSARIVDKIVNYTHILEIDGFAEIIVERLHSAGLLNSISDLYKLKNHKDEIAKLDRMSIGIAEKLCTNIENAKNAEVWKLLAALGIPNVGPKTAKTLIKKFKSIEGVANATHISLESTDDIAEITANGIYSWFRDKDNIELVLNVTTSGQKTFETEVDKSSNSLDGKTFCITGALSKPRKEFEKMIEAAGGKIVSGVSSKTNFLITNDTTSGSSKNIKAKELNIPILNENDLMKLLRS